MQGVLTTIHRRRGRRRVVRRVQGISHGIRNRPSNGTLHLITLFHGSKGSCRETQWNGPHQRRSKRKKLNLIRSQIDIDGAKSLDMWGTTDRDTTNLHSQVRSPIKGANPMSITRFHLVRIASEDKSWEIRMIEIQELIRQMFLRKIVPKYLHQDRTCDHLLERTKLPPRVQVEKRQLLGGWPIPTTVSNHSTSGAFNTVPDILKRKRTKILIITKAVQRGRLHSTMTMRKRLRDTRRTCSTASTRPTRTNMKFHRHVGSATRVQRTLKTLKTCIDTHRKHRCCTAQASHK
jgi:hypothetical protein